MSSDSYPLFLPFTFDSISKACNVSDNPRSNVRVFNVILDVIRVGNLIMSVFPACLDSVYMIERSSVCIDNFFSDKYHVLTVSVFNDSYACSVDIDNDLSSCVSDWLDVYNHLLRVACTCPILFDALSCLDIDYLNDACFPWYLDKIAGKGGE